MSEKNNKLEIYISEKLKVIDPEARLTKASGASTELFDVSNKYFWVECKQRLTRENIIIDYKKDYLKTFNQIPLNNNKMLLLAHENKYHKRFVTLEVEEFFNLLYQKKIL